MPFKSEAQRRYLWANEPKIARRWTNEHGSKPVRDPDRSAAIKRRLQQRESSTTRIAKGEPGRKLERHDIPGRRQMHPPLKQRRAIPGRKSDLSAIPGKLERAAKRRLLGPLARKF